jgi:hypothetical protein
LLGRERLNRFVLSRNKALTSLKQSFSLRTSLITYLRRNYIPLPGVAVCVDVPGAFYFIINSIVLPFAHQTTAKQRKISVIMMSVYYSHSLPFPFHSPSPSKWASTPAIQRRCGRTKHLSRSILLCCIRSKRKTLPLWTIIRPARVS